MKYVLDSCVALKWVLPEPDAAAAAKVRDEFRRGGHELIAPDIFAVEVAHNLAKSERRGIIPPGEGAIKLADIFTDYAGPTPLPRPLTSGVRHRLGGSASAFTIVCTSPSPSRKVARS